MIQNLKNNTKIKTIAFMSSIVLWMYVMAVVDPEETKVLENIPIKITNTNELRENNLIIYPQQELTTNIYITGKLSNLKGIDKKDINIYGEINSPIEGKNEVFLEASTSQSATYEFKNSIMIVNLEKVIQEKRTLDIEIEGFAKNNIDELVVEDNIDSIKISGPRTLVNEVQKVVGVLDVGSRKEDFYQVIKLQPVDNKGNVVEGVEIDKTHIRVNVTMLQEKVVPIILNIVDNEGNKQSIENYKLSQNEVTIRGKKSIIDTIESISTKEIKLDVLLEEKTKELSLVIPEGIISNLDNIEITINNNNIRELIYNSNDIEIKNLSQDNEKIIPNDIEVIVTYYSEREDIEKSDIKLYVDLSDNTNSDLYDIQYEAKSYIKDVSINPKSIEINN